MFIVLRYVNKNESAIKRFLGLVLLFMFQIQVLYL